MERRSSNSPCPKQAICRSRWQTLFPQGSREPSTQGCLFLHALGLQIVTKRMSKRRVFIFVCLASPSPITFKHMLIHRQVFDGSKDLAPLFTTPRQGHATLQSLVLSTRHVLGNTSKRDNFYHLVCCILFGILLQNLSNTCKGSPQKNNVSAATTEPHAQRMILDFVKAKYSTLV